MLKNIEEWGREKCIGIYPDSTTICDLYSIPKQ